jgi:hypothetical protein
VGATPAALPAAAAAANTQIERRDRPAKRQKLSKAPKEAEAKFTVTSSSAGSNWAVMRQVGGKWVCVGASWCC